MAALDAASQTGLKALHSTHVKAQGRSGQRKGWEGFGLGLLLQWTIPCHGITVWFVIFFYYR